MWTTALPERATIRTPGFMVIVVSHSKKREIAQYRLFGTRTDDMICEDHPSIVGAYADVELPVLKHLQV